MDELKNLLTCGSPWAEQRAAIALELHDQHAKGDVSTDEFNALLQDLINTDVLNSEADDMNVKSALIMAVSGCMKLV